MFQLTYGLTELQRALKLFIDMDVTYSSYRRVTKNAMITIEFLMEIFLFIFIIIELISILI